MARSYKRFTPGEKVTAFPGGTWNQLVDAAKWVDGVRSGGLNLTPPPQDNQAIAISIRNNTGADIDVQYPILGIGEPLQTVEDDDTVMTRSVQFNGEDPDPEHHELKFAILQSPVGEDEFSEGVVYGWSWARVFLKEHHHRTCGIWYGVTDHLVSGYPGANIIWAEFQHLLFEDDWKKEQWAIVEVGFRGPQKVIITETIDAAGWNKTTGDLTPEKFTCTPMYGNIFNDGKYTYNDGAGQEQMDAYSFYTTAVEVGTDKARIGYVQNGELLIVDCNEIDQKEVTP
jgi:hypothetical protein